MRHLYRRRVVIFILGTLCSLLIVPMVNIIAAPNQSAIKWQEKSFFYNVDFVSRWLALGLYPFGISLDPTKVIIGRHDWLFLGDGFGETLTADRRTPGKADATLGQKIGDFAEAWNSYLVTKGVTLFRVMIAPNKGAIYPENLPNWAYPASPNATDIFFLGTGSTYYLDLRAPMLDAKLQLTYPLYYKTDTHWNKLGAKVAFQAFARQVSAVAPEIRWPLDSDYGLEHIDLREGGDLAKFLRLSAYLSDMEPLFYSNKSLKSLNSKKVLWVRDSFGEAMAPLMMATFSEVIEVYSGIAFKQDGTFVDLVEKWKPDYVFVTLVERDKAGLAVFATQPPTR